MSPSSEVAGESATNRLVVTASEEEMIRIEQVIKQVDQADGGVRETRVYRLDDGDSQDLAMVLRQLVPKAFFTYRTSPPLVVAAGAPTDLAKVDAVVEQYQGLGAEELKTQVFTLVSSDAESLVEAVEAISPQAKVSSDAATNSLLVTASESDLAKIEEIVSRSTRVAGNRWRRKSTV